MNPSDQFLEEEQFRQVERALLCVDDAARRLGEIATSLRKDDAAPHLVAALETAAEAVSADHRQLMKSVYFRAPDSGQQQLIAEPDDKTLAR